jgi:hypothetical protein
VSSAEFEPSSIGREKAAGRRDESETQRGIEAGIDLDFGQLMLMLR